MRLGIDYGTGATRAVLVWPGGRWTGLLFDGTALLPSAVHADPDGTLRTGQQAWQQATLDPEGFVAYPKRHLTEGRLRLGERDVDVLDLVAATLHRVAQEATRVGGEPVGEVSMTVPASWGPARRALLRKAATRAGLPPPVLVESAVAVAAHLLTEGAVIPVGAAILVCDLGVGGGEATVVRRHSGGFDVLARVDSALAGTAAIDEALAEYLAAITARLATPGPPAPERATDGSVPALDGQVARLAAARTAREGLTHAPAVAVPHAGLPVVVDQPTLHTLAQPVLAHAVATIRTALVVLRHDPVTEPVGPSLRSAWMYRLSCSWTLI